LIKKMLPVPSFIAWRQLFRAFAIVVLGCVADAQVAQAIDCAKAQSRIERVICFDAGLKQKDAEFAKSFFELLRAVSNGDAPSERETLLAEQRDWLRSREKLCAAVAAGQLPQCVASSIDFRREQLGREWGTRPADQDPLKTKQLSVGNVTLVVSSECSNDTSSYGLSYKSKVIVCGLRGLYEESPFVVKRRLTNGDNEAALLESHDGGEMNCSHYYILSVEAHGDLNIQKFGTSCLVPNSKAAVLWDETTKKTIGEFLPELEGGGSAFRTEQGFEFFRKPSAQSAGERLQWNWKTGYSKTTIAYAPEGGKSMNDLANAKPTEFKEPLENAEFYRAVLALPDPDKDDFLVSLSGLNSGCDCVGPIDYSLYGLRNTADVYAMSGCGIYLEGHYVRCSGADALAVWEKGTGKFYFAIIHGGQNGKRLPPSAVHAFPTIDTWSDIVRAQFADWQKNARWAN
jgi:uncharacterized protein YecT (DUF1311 family)